jgi:galactokinase
MEEPVPVSREIIDNLHPPEAIQAQKQRWSHLIQRFHDIYGNKPPNFVSRSPGRVNLIGEHIDYSLYEVLPMAIAADILIAVSASLNLDSTAESRISIANVNSERFASTEFVIPIAGEADIDSSIHSWTNYFKAGLNGALLLLRKEKPEIIIRSMQVMVDGTIPAGGGLSSSAAFVCASALAVLRANGADHIIKGELVELAIVSERAVGVNSGGMDQAASVLSTRGQALSVSFSPVLHAEAIPFPPFNPPITFMIAQSFVAADKHLTAPECYNLRVVECTLAAEVMAASLNLTLQTDSSPLHHSLRGVQTAYFATTVPSATPEAQLQAMVHLVGSHLGQTDGYTLPDIASILSTTTSALLERLTSRFPIRARIFHLARRATHVFSEALRVLEFKSLLRTHPMLPASNLLPRLGYLMNESQFSCRQVYDCSCPELDRLCEIARDAGAYGSRLTGAGWGGCTVHLVPKGQVDMIRAAWEKEYYRVREPDISPERLAEAMIVSEPGQGSGM